MALEATKMRLTVLVCGRIAPFSMNWGWTYLVKIELGRFLKNWFFSFFRWYIGQFRLLSWILLYFLAFSSNSFLCLPLLLLILKLLFILQLFLLIQLLLLLRMTLFLLQMFLRHLFLLSAIFLILLLPLLLLHLFYQVHLLLLTLL